MEGDHVGRRASTRLSQTLVAGEGDGARARSSSTSTRAAASRASSTAGSPAYGMPAHLSVDFEADSAAIEANRRTYGVAWPSLELPGREAHRLVRRRLPRGVGRERSAAARLRRRARQARRRAALRVHRPAPLAHRTERRRVDRVQAGQRARDRQRARRQGQRSAGGDRRAASTPRRCSGSPTSSRRRSRALVLSGVTRRRRARRRARGRRDQPGRRRRRHDDQAGASRSRRSTASRPTASVLAAVERMRAGQVAHRVRARREPGVRAAEGARSSPRRSRRCRSR